MFIIYNLETDKIYTKNNYEQSLLYYINYSINRDTIQYNSLK